MVVICGKDVLARAQIAFELSDLGDRIMGRNLRRRFPNDDPEAIERRLLSSVLHARHRLFDEPARTSSDSTLG